MKPAAVPSTADLLATADQCVLCGLCSAQCPTYALYQVEAESPRGRIMLIQGLLRGQLHADRATLGYLDHCLTCRRCEALCPSGVAYGRLIDGVKARFPRRPALMARWLTHSRSLTTLLRTLLLALPARALPHWGRVVKRYARPATLVGADDSAELALFTGCATALADTAAIAATQKLLAAAGVRAAIPPAQQCCGAVDLHAGRQDRWYRLAQANASAFPVGVRQIISLNPACTATLRDYRYTNGDAPAVAARAVDAGAYLLRLPAWKTLRFNKMTLRVGIHIPCAQRNALKDAPSTQQLLQAVPGLTLIPLPEIYACCGAAGTQMLTAAKQAQSLRAPLLSFIDEQRLDVVVTTNVGCGLHLTEGLLTVGAPVRVMHPITLLADALIYP